jgi:hypothetical protein
MKLAHDAIARPMKPMSEVTVLKRSSCLTGANGMPPTWTDTMPRLLL